MDQSDIVLSLLAFAWVCFGLAGVFVFANMRRRPTRSPEDVMARLQEAKLKAEADAHDARLKLAEARREARERAVQEFEDARTADKVRQAQERKAGVVKVYENGKADSWAFNPAPRVSNPNCCFTKHAVQSGSRMLEDDSFTNPMSPLNPFSPVSVWSDSSDSGSSCSSDSGSSCSSDSGSSCSSAD